MLCNFRPLTSESKVSLIEVVDVCVIWLLLAGVDAMALLFLLKHRRFPLERGNWWRVASENPKLERVPDADVLKEVEGSKDPESWMASSKYTFGTFVG